MINLMTLRRCGLIFLLRSCGSVQVSYLTVPDLLGLSVPDTVAVDIVSAVVDPLVRQHAAVAVAVGAQPVPLAGIRALQPAGLQVAVLIEVVPVAVDLLPVVGGVGTVCVAVPPAVGISQPCAAGRGAVGRSAAAGVRAGRAAGRGSAAGFAAEIVQDILVDIPLI